MPRLFLAIDPPVPVREALTGLQTNVPGARWAPPEKVHLTLHFLGDVADEQVPLLEAALAQVNERGFSLSVEGLGAFPNTQSARVLVAQVGLDPGLALLRDQTGAALELLGFASERRPYRPHLTLARLKRPDRQAVRAFLTQPVPALPFEVEAFHLYASRLYPEGTRYTGLRSFPLT
jgi:2'-5' RNA ligase